jgi:hypothetical protein
MTHVDMCLRLSSLEAIDCVSNQERSKASPNKKASHSEKKGRRDLLLTLRPGFPRKLAPRNIATYARNMRMHIPCTIPGIVIGLRKQNGKIQFPHCQERQKETQLD